MNTQNVTTKRPAELTGELIDKDYALRLMNGFKKKFPGEVSSLFINVQTVFDSVNGAANVSGIRFMYGMETANDPASKVILLIPCNNTSTDRPIPNTILQPPGYLNNRGELVSLKRTWELLYNHAVHYAKLTPDVKFHKIVRGAFFGIESLRMLLKEFTKAHGMDFHFGYDEAIEEPALRHKPVLNPVHANGSKYEIYQDMASLCPPFCHCGEPGYPPCYDDGLFNNRMAGIISTLTSKYETNGPWVEMYYYISPALTEAIERTDNATEIYTAIFNNEVNSCNELIGKGKYEEAKVLFEQTIEGLMQKYLFGKS